MHMVWHDDVCIRNGASDLIGMPDFICNQAPSLRSEKMGCRSRQHVVTRYARPDSDTRFLRRNLLRGFRIAIWRFLRGTIQTYIPISWQIAAKAAPTLVWECRFRLIAPDRQIDGGYISGSSSSSDQSCGVIEVNRGWKRVTISQNKSAVISAS